MTIHNFKRDPSEYVLAQHDNTTVPEKKGIWTRIKDNDKIKNINDVVNKGTVYFDTVIGKDKDPTYLQTVGDPLCTHKICKILKKQDKTHSTNAAVLCSKIDEKLREQLSQGKEESHILVDDERAIKILEKDRPEQKENEHLQKLEGQLLTGRLKCQFEDPRTVLNELRDLPKKFIGIEKNKNYQDLYQNLSQNIEQATRLSTLFYHGARVKVLLDLVKEGYDVGDKGICTKNGVPTEDFKDIRWNRLIIQDPCTEFLKYVNMKSSTTPYSLNLRLAGFFLKASPEEMLKLGKREIEKKETDNFSIKALSKLYGNQEIFNQGMSEAIDLGASFIKENKGDIYNGLFFLFGDRRHLIAFLQDPDTCDKAGAELGKVRSSDVGGRGCLNETESSLIGPYRDLGRILKKKFLETIEVDKSHSVGISYELENPDGFPDTWSSKVRGYGGDALVFYIKVKDESGKCWAIPANAYLPHENVILHTYRWGLPMLHKECKKVFGEALEIKDESKCKEKLLKFFWLFCQAKPYERGDPSVAEMFCASVCRAKGWDFKWNQGLIPWVEVCQYDDIHKFAKADLLQK